MQLQQDRPTADRLEKAMHKHRKIYHCSPRIKPTPSLQDKEMDALVAEKQG